MRVLSRFWRRSHENFAGQFITASRRIRARVVWSIHWREAGAGGRWPDLSCGRTLKTRDWKTQNQISRVENARPPYVEREMDKSKVERNIVWYVYYIIIIMLHFATHAHDVPAFFSPAFSTPGNLVPCFPVLTFPVPRFQSPPLSYRSLLSRHTSRMMAVGGLRTASDCWSTDWFDLQRRINLFRRNVPASLINTSVFRHWFACVHALLS